MRAALKPPLLPGAGTWQAEARARELEQVLEQSGEAVVGTDLDAVVTYWNREATSLYGFTAQEAIGQPLRKLHAADLSDVDYARIENRIRSGLATSSSTERRKKNGDIVRVALKTTPLRDVDGNLIGEITVARDVTTLHRTEEALRAAHATLKARLAAIREANRNLSREIAARRKADAAMVRNNHALAATVRQLESFQRDNQSLSRMAELLQSCTRRGEAYAIVRETGAQLFPELVGIAFHLSRVARPARAREHVGQRLLARRNTLRRTNVGRCGWAVPTSSRAAARTIRCRQRERRDGVVRLHARAGAGADPRPAALGARDRPALAAAGGGRGTTAARHDRPRRPGARQSQTARCIARNGAARRPDRPCTTGPTSRTR